MEGLKGGINISNERQLWQKKIRFQIVGDGRGWWMEGLKGGVGE